MCIFSSHINEYVFIVFPKFWIITSYYETYFTYEVMDHGVSYVVQFFKTLQ